MILRCTVFLMLASVALSIASGAPLGLQAWLEPILLCYPPDTAVRMAATTAGSGEGQDYRLLQPGETATVITVSGPAVIHRVWSTSQYTEATRLLLRIDGKQQVLWEKGRLPAGVATDDPLRAMEGKAYCSYVPLKVAREAKFIAYDLRPKETKPTGDPHATGNKFYLQVEYSAGTEMASEPDLKRVRSQIRKLTDAPLADVGGPVSMSNPRVPPPGWQTVSVGTGAVLLLRGNTITLKKPPGVEAENRGDQPPETPEPQVGPEIDDRWVITTLALHAEGATFDQLQKTRLIIKSGDPLEPCADVPIPYLFAAYWALDEYASPITAIAEETLVCRWPIPIGKGLQLSVEPMPGAEGVKGLTLSVRRQHLDKAPPYRFCAEYRSQISKRGEPLTLADIKGEGVFLGCTFAADGLAHRRFTFLEGNERIYVDGALKPTWEGTGTEDFFNSAWYFSGGVHARPFHGLTHLSQGPPPRMSAYRYLIPDRVGFKRSLRVEMQHGSRNSSPNTLYRSVAIWYQKPPCKVTAPAEAQIPVTTGPFPPPSEEQSGGGGVDPVTPTILAVLVLLAVAAGLRYLLRKRQ